jgi:LPS-assembly protein
MGYSYDRDTLRQYVTSFAWPINQAWSSYGRVVYSQLDHKFLDHFAGLEYRSCCWNIRAVIGRAVTTRTGAYDTQYRIQLELKGLSSVGTADTFLESSIPGYSARDR